MYLGVVRQEQPIFASLTPPKNTMTLITLLGLIWDLSSTIYNNPDRTGRLIFYRILRQEKQIQPVGLPGLRIHNHITSVADPGCLSRIPDPNCLHPRSRIRIKEFKRFIPKNRFLSSRKYDPGCSSRNPDPDADFYPSRIPGSNRHRIPDPQHCI